MNKLIAFIGLKITNFMIAIYESRPFGFLDEQDKKDLTKLWDYHDDFNKELGIGEKNERKC